MIKSKDEILRKPIEIDLTGPDGNVFVLMAYADRLAQQIWGRETTEEMELGNDIVDIMNEFGGKDKDVAKTMREYIHNKMMESDYENAVKVFDHYFGSVVTLYR